MWHAPLRPFARAFLAVLALVALPAAAAAQESAFRASQPWFIGPSSSVGVNWKNGIANAESLWVDSNGDGVISPGDRYYPTPTPLRTGGWELRLSPTRRHLFARTSDPCPQNPSRVGFWSIPVAYGAPLPPLGPVVTMIGCYLDVRFGDRPWEAPESHAFVEQAEVGGSVRLYWWNLSTGEQGQTLALEQGANSVTFDSLNAAAWIEHGIGTPDGVDYTMVELCAGSLGASYGTGFLDQGGARRAFADRASTPRNAVIRDLSGAYVPPAFPIVECVGGGDPTGACCLPDGGCQDGVTAAECAGLGGAYQGDGTPCATADCPVPGPLLALTGSAPGTALQRSNLTYTLVVSNTGTGPSTPLTVTASIPFQAQFVSATQGGTYNGAARQVSWALAALGTGGSVQLEYTILTPCFQTSISLTTYSVRETTGPPVNGTPSPLVTGLTTQSQDPVAIASSSVALDPTPLGTGDHVRHTVTITETAGVARDSISFSVVSGEGTVFDQVVDAGGGRAGFAGTSLQWTGPLPAFGSTTVVVDAVVEECRGPDPVSSVLNRGLPFAVRNPCGFSLAVHAPTTAVPVAGVPLRAFLEAPGLGAPQQALGYTLVLTRPGAEFDLVLRVVNSEPDPAPVCDVTVPFPAGLEPVGNPPFVGTPPPGASWDDPSRLLGWTGSPPPNGEVAVTVRARVASGACRAQVDATGSHGSCSGGLDAGLTVLAVPEPPPGAHALIESAYDGTRTFRPGVDPAPVGELCFPAEYLSGMDRGPDGDVWLTGIPRVIRYNPATLAFRVYSEAFMTDTLGMSTIADCAVDPADSSVIFSGYLAGIGMRVKRYQPRTGQVTTLYSEPSFVYGLAQHVVVDPAGRIVLMSNEHVLRITPGTPGPPEVFTDASVETFTSMCLDTSGAYLLASMDYASNDRRLKSLDPATGAFTEIADLDPLAGLYGFEGMDVRADGTIVAGQYYGELYAMTRAPAFAKTHLASLAGELADLEWVNGSGGVDVPPAPGAPPAALALAPPAPNPARGTVRLRWALPATGHVTLEVFDLGGRRVRVLADGAFEPGMHERAWDGRDDAGRALGPGIYFARLLAGGATRTVKLVLAR